MRTCVGGGRLIIGAKLVDNGARAMLRFFRAANASGGRDCNSSSTARTGQELEVGDETKKMPPRAQERERESYRRQNRFNY